MALRLRGGGIRWIHPLRGGLAGWIDAGFPVEELRLVAEAGRG